MYTDYGASIIGYYADRAGPQILLDFVAFFLRRRLFDIGTSTYPIHKLIVQPR